MPCPELAGETRQLPHVEVSHMSFQNPAFSAKQPENHIKLKRQEQASNAWLPFHRFFSSIWSVFMLNSRKTHGFSVGGFGSPASMRRQQDRLH